MLWICCFLCMSIFLSIWNSVNSQRLWFWLYQRLFHVILCFHWFILFQFQCHLNKLLWSRSATREMDRVIEAHHPPLSQERNVNLGHLWDLTGIRRPQKTTPTRMSLIVHYKRSNSKLKFLLEEPCYTLISWTQLLLVPECEAKCLRHLVFEQNPWKKLEAGCLSWSSFVETGGFGAFGGVKVTLVQSSGR